MTETGRKPDYKGNFGLSCWEEKDKNGNAYLSCQLGTHVALFPYPYPEKGQK